MLSIVKRHKYTAAEDCHSPDQDIGMALAKELHSDFEDSSPFGHYVNQLSP